MFGSETPRTDKEEYRTDIDETSVPAEFARELEIELDDVKDQLEQAKAEIERLKALLENKETTNV